MCTAAPAICDVCIFGHDKSSCAGNQTVMRPNFEHHRTDRCIELEVLAICGLGDVQVSQEEPLYGVTQSMFHCVDGLSQQGEEVNDYSMQLC